MLDSLNGDHKQLLAKLIGGLAVDSVVDLEAVAPELDEALTPEEKRSINEAGSALDLNSAQALDDFLRRMMESGEESVAFGSGGPLGKSYGKPSMTMLILSIEELLTKLNGFKQTSGR